MITRLLVTLSILTTFPALAQVYNYNFGTVVDSITSNTAVVSPTFLPAPGDGASFARARVGTDGGKIVLNTYPGIGSGSAMRIQAPTGTSLNKFSIAGVASPSTTFGIRFSFSLGDANNDPLSVVASGLFYFFAGNGPSLSDDNAFMGSEVFSGIQLTCGPAGAVFSYRDGGNWSTLPLPLVVAYGSATNIALYMNNSASAISYTDINNTVRTLPANSWGLFANNFYVATLPKAQLATGTAINAFTIYGSSSLLNQANVFVDDIVYTNNILANTLPIKVSAFNGKTVGRDVRLAWQTETETGMNFFSVEHAADGRNFREIGKVECSHQPSNEYGFTHTSAAEVNYYRLRIQEDNGSSQYSNTIKLKMLGSDVLDAWYANGYIHMQHHKGASVNVFDLSGRMVQSSVVAGTDYTVSLADLEPGIYVANIEDGGSTVTIKFVK